MGRDLLVGFRAGGVLTWLKGGLDMGVVTVEGVVATVLGFRAGV